MPTQLTPHALVTTMHITNYGQVILARYEIEQRFMPVCVNNFETYSVETHREGFSVKDLLRSAPVDIATWLHRSGLWDAMPPET